MMTPITFDANSNIIRIRVLDSASTTGAGKTGIPANAAALRVCVIADNQAVANANIYAGATGIDSLLTIGTYQPPASVAWCRWGEVDSTNFPGLYEIHLHNDLFSISGAKKLYISIYGATGAVQTMGVIPLWTLDTATAMRGTDNAALATTALSNATWTDTKAGYLNAAVGSIPTNPYTGTPPDAASIADAVWDEASTGHTTMGKAGEQLWTNVPAVKTNTDQLTFVDVGGVKHVKASLYSILGSAITETVGGYLSAAFKKLFDVATPLLTAASAMRGTDNAVTSLSGIATATDVTTSQGVITGAITTSQGVITGTMPAAAPSASTIADAVLDEAKGTHSGWLATNLPTDFDTVTVTDNKIDANASVALTQEDIDAIAAGVSASIGGVGGISWTHNVTLDGIPKSDAWVGFYLSSSPTILAASGRTNESGNVTLQLDAGNYNTKVVIDDIVTTGTATVA